MLLRRPHPRKGERCGQNFADDPGPSVTPRRTMKRASRLVGLAAAVLAAASACKGSNNERGSMDTTNGKAPRAVQVADCASLPGAGELAKFLKQAPDSG